MCRIGFVSAVSCSIVLWTGAAAAAADDGQGADEQRLGQDVQVGGDANKRYFLIGPKAEAAKPAEGYKLLIVLPGGDGSAEFGPFVERIFQKALGDEYIVAQLVAVKWSTEQSIVWPTRATAVEGAKFTTEEFIRAVVDDVRQRHAIDERFVFTLSWSSGGPAAYAVSLDEGTPIRGSFVAMSVFKPQELPDLARAKGKAYYILHSPQDFIKMRFPEAARDQLAANGAKTKLATYEGGHGWRGDVFGNIRAGMEWLEEQVSEKQE